MFTLAAARLCDSQATDLPIAFVVDLRMTAFEAGFFAESGSILNVQLNLLLRGKVIGVKGGGILPKYGTTKTSMFSTSVQSRVASAVLDSVLRPLGLARHLCCSRSHVSASRLRVLAGHRAGSKRVQDWGVAGSNGR